MLSGVKLLSRDEAERADEKDRKHKKEKKRRNKDKKDKDRKHRHRSSSSEPDSPRERAQRGPSDPADTTAVADNEAAAAEPGVQREDWMTVPMGRPAIEPSQPATETPSEDDGKPKVSSKELNPDLMRNAAAAPTSVAARPASAVGDGGASWRMKALRRAQAQAAEGGERVADVVAGRWGSLGELAGGVTGGRAAHAMAHTHAARDRRRAFAVEGDGDGQRERGGGGGGGYLADVKSSRSQMRRPSEGDLSVSWRRSGGGRSSRGESGSGSDVRSRSRVGGDDRDVLAAAAPEMNAFANDGSFMDQFAKKQGPGEEQEEEPVRKGGSESSGSKGEDERQPRRREDHHHHHRPPRPPPLRTTKGNEDKEPIGNKNVAAMLRARLGGKPPPTAAVAPPGDETIALPLVDAAGRAAPGAFGRESAGAAEGAVRPIKRVERYEGGEKRRYYADDDATDLATLVKRTKYEGAADIDANLARNIARKSRFRESDMDADAEYDFDGGLDLADGRRAASKDARRRGSGAEEAARREKQRQVREYSKFTTALDRCALCFSSTGRPKHLTLAIGNAAYLALPRRGRLVPGHCQIVPAEHVASTRAADESAWTEVRNFKKCLLRMYAAQGMECVFFETAPRPGDVRAHAVVDCVPLPPDAAAKAPMYFRKAIDDATSDWAQHAAKRFIDTSTKGLRGAIPPNFPYFHIEFGLGAGFVHVIDNPEEFDVGLARSVLIGLLHLPEEDAHRRARQENESIQVQWAQEFRQQFDEYDWTKQL